MAAYKDSTYGKVANVARVGGDRFRLRVCDKKGNVICDEVLPTEHEALQNLGVEAGCWVDGYVEHHVGAQGENVVIANDCETHRAMMSAVDAQGVPLMVRYCDNVIVARNIFAAVFG